MSRKHLFVVGIVATGMVVLTGCQRAAPGKVEELATPVVANTPAPAVVAGAICRLPAYDLATLHQTVATRTRLREEVVAALVRRNPQLPAYWRAYRPYQVDLYALDTLQGAHYQLQTLLCAHEECCQDLFYLTFTPDGQRLLDWRCVASSGADGFWHAEWQMHVAPSGHLRVTTVAENREDDIATFYRDSVVQVFALTPQGRLTRQRVDSSRTQHTDAEVVEQRRQAAP